MSKVVEQSAFKMPIIVRARGYRLYDQKGRRYIDLYQNNGRAVLGHRPEGLNQVMKATASRGLFAEYPSVYDKRLEKILKLMFTDYSKFRLYANRERAMEALSLALGKQVRGRNITDPAMTDQTSEKLMFWRPFIPEQQVKPDLLLPIFPFPGSFVPYVVCIRNVQLLKKMPASDMISPFLLDGLIKSISLLIRTMHSPTGSGSEFQRLIDVLEWDRRGPYINTRLESVAYAEVFKKALEQGVLLPPGENYPVIIPREFSEGEIQGVLRFVRSLNGG
ncbi:MAG: glutamate-1-semialdehyde aminotransferase [Spirochaetota bacterium]